MDELFSQNKMIISWIQTYFFFKKLRNKWFILNFLLNNSGCSVYFNIGSCLSCTMLKLLKRMIWYVKWKCSPLYHKRLSVGYPSFLTYFELVNPFLSFLWVFLSFPWASSLSLKSKHTLTEGCEVRYQFSK